MTRALILTFLWTTSAVALPCSTTGHHGWSWREIDGRRCWYPGHRGYSKTRLHWVAHPAHGPNPVETAPVEAAPRVVIVPVKVLRPTFEEIWNGRIQ